MPPNFSYNLTPESYYPPSYHPALHYRPTIPSDYLPNDEHRYLVKLQDRSRLETHFAQASLFSSPYISPPKTAYQEQRNLGRKWRTKVSETAYATRAALGPGFDFTDEGYESMQTVDNNRYASSRYRDESGHQDYVPSRRVHELSKKYWDDDQRYRNEQYRKNGYSTHSGRRVDTSPLGYPEPTPPPRRERHDSGTGESTVYGPTSELSSTFSWSSCDEDEPPKRRRWGHPRRSREAG